MVARSPAGTALKIAFFVAVLAGCSDPPIAAPSAGTDTIIFKVEASANVLVTVTASVRDTDSLDTRFSGSCPAQSAPFLLQYSPAKVPAEVSLSIQLTYVGGSALTGGPNVSTEGDILVDPGARFSQYRLPLFVVDDLEHPTIVADVSRVTQTTLALSRKFSAGRYYLFRTLPVRASVVWTSPLGTLEVPFDSRDDLALVRFSTVL